ncbi:hypothetical protein [Lacinutrix sp. Bg11-31]|uniref:hypothetical protein n=1 Tax=Lacinutrix sp. Bg11-31 TaxID=2057808 RepID=UPI000C30B871|nr:hypothetical protein [Lacinutrix sp. Bg11-31]AUC81439.1 hypothetical protein CW733_04565 [Lacinutrix sp. Bg11-31]
MTKRESVSTRFLKNTNAIDIIFYLFFLASIVVSILFDKAQLLYTTPIVIISIIIKYISLTKKKANPFFIFALLATLVSNVLSLYCFESCFGWVATFTSLYLISCSFVLKKYLYRGKVRSLLSFSVIVSVILIIYVLYTILELLIYSISDNQMFFIFLATLSLIVYTITFAIIYINDNYNNGTVLLASGIFTFFQIALVSINEFLHFNKTFTVLISICHIMAIYLLMNFIAKTEVIKPEDIKNKFF